MQNLDYRQLLLSYSDPQLRISLANQRTHAIAASIRSAADGVFTVFPYFPRDCSLAVPLRGKPGHTRTLSWMQLTREGFTYVRLFIAVVLPGELQPIPLPSRFYLDVALPHPFKGSVPPPSELDFGGATIWVEGLAGWLVGMELPPAALRPFFPPALGIPTTESGAVAWDLERHGVGGVVKRLNGECAEAMLSLHRQGQMMDIATL